MGSKAGTKTKDSEEREVTAHNKGGEGPRRKGRRQENEINNGELKENDKSSGYENR